MKIDSAPTVWYDLQVAPSLIWRIATTEGAALKRTSRKRMN